MSDEQQVPLETTEGWQPRASAGERIMVVLAAMALVGGVLIVAGNLLGKDDAVSVASASPEPSVGQVPTPFPSPSPMELTLVQRSPTPAAPDPLLFSGWIRAKVDVEILGSRSEGTPAIGTLQAGGVAYAYEESAADQELGWLHMEGPVLTGWLPTRAGGEDLVRRYLYSDVTVSGGFSNLAAGPEGFVAIGNAAGMSNNYPPPAVFASTDGAAWHAASEPPAPGFYPAGVAWGPAGWLLVTSDGWSESPRVWSSGDGDQWRSLGVLDAGYPEGMHASSAGYLLLTSGDSRGSRTAWFSADGVRWSESRPGLVDYYQVIATSAGFYASNTPGYFGLPATSKAAFSADGLSWSPAPANLKVVAVGGDLLAIESFVDGSTPSPWRGSFYRGKVGWRPMDDKMPFTNAVVTLLVSDGQRATAFGWNRSTEAALSWTSDGGEWYRDELPAQFGGPPLMAAAGETGIVVVGRRPNTRGDNPVLWHRSARGSWMRERSPVLGLAPDPAASDCTPPPSDAAEFLNLDHAMAVACYGDAPLTIRLWSTNCEDCNGEPSGTYNPMWLAFPSANMLVFSPVEWPGGGWWGQAVLDPALGPSPDPSWDGAWLELTGHFDDPAAADCRWIPPADQLQYYGGARSIIDGCRQQFVVTAVRVVDGP